MLTPKMHDALRFIEDYQLRHGGVSPTISDIAGVFGSRKSKAITRDLLVEIERLGVIRRLPHRVRAIEVLRPVTKTTAFKFDDTTKTLVPLTGKPRT